MKKVIPILTLALPFIVAGQNQKIDSLTVAIDQMANDTSKVIALTDLAFEFSFIDARNTIKLGKQAYELADSLSFEKGMARSLRNTAVGYMYNNILDSAKYSGQSAYELALSIGDHQLMGDAMNTLGNVFYLKSEYDSSRIAHERSKNHFNEIGNTIGSAIANSSIGLTYSEQGKYLQALERYQEALVIYEREKLNNNIANNYNNIANIYLERGEDDKALDYYLKTAKYDSITGNKAGRAHTLLNVGNILHDLGRSEEAKENYWLSIRLAIESGSVCASAMPKTQLGDLYLDQQDLDSALYYISLAIDQSLACDNERSLSSAYLDLGQYYLIRNELVNAEKAWLAGFKAAERAEIKPKMEELANALHNVYSKQENFREAYYYGEKARKLQQELFNKENTQKITWLEAEYEFEKEKQLLQSKQARKDLEYQQEIEKQNWIKYAFITIASFLATIAIIAYRSYKTKKADNLLLGEKNQHLEELRMREKRLSEETVAAKERELATMAMSTHEKNSLLQELEQKVSFLETRLDDSVSKDLKEMRRTISDSYSLDKSWDSFIHKFEDVHPQFFDSLKGQNPNLTINDLKLSAYLKIGMTNKEIANVTHLTHGSVKSSINRLKKKLDMKAEDSIRDFVMKYA